MVAFLVIMLLELGQERRNRQKYTLRGPKRVVTPKQGSEGSDPGGVQKSVLRCLGLFGELEYSERPMILMSLLYCRQ